MKVDFGTTEASARPILISGSRPGSQPPNLQGIWDECLNPLCERKQNRQNLEIPAEFVFRYHDSHCKPFAIFVGQRWLLWYNGRHGDLEQIGLAIHKGEDLEFSNLDSVSSGKKHAVCYAMIGALMAFIFSQSDESDAARIERWTRRTKA